MKLSPYEEVAYDVYPMINSSNYGSGLVGELDDDMSEIEFLAQLKSKFHVSALDIPNYDKKSETSCRMWRFRKLFTC